MDENKKTEEFSINGEELVAKVKDIVKQGNAKKIMINLQFPVSFLTTNRLMRDSGRALDPKQLVAIVGFLERFLRDDFVLVHLAFMIAQVHE